MIPPAHPISLSSSLCKTSSIALAVAAALSFASAARAQDTRQDVNSGATDLSAGASYTPATAPTVTSDVTFTSGTAYNPAAFSVGNTSLTFGSLNDLTATALTISNSTGTAARTLTLGGTGNLGNSVSGTAADLLYVATGGNLTIAGGSGTTALGLVLGQSGNFNIAGTGAANISANISGAFALTKTGTGTLNLSGANTFSGGLTISSGTVSTALNTALGGTNGTAGAITLNGGTLNFTNSNGALTDTHAITVGASGGAISMTGTATSGQNSRVILDTDNLLLGSGPLTVSGRGTLGGTLGTTNTGAGALVLNKANTGTGGFTGNITLQSGGLVEYGNGNSLLSTATVTLGNEGEFVVNSTTTNNAVTVSGGTNSVLSFGYNGGGTFSGPITANALLTVGLRAWYNYSQAYSGTISGVISGAGGMTTTGGGTLTLTNTNTYLGATTIGTGGTLRLGSGGTTAALSASSAITDNGTLAINRSNAVTQGTDFGTIGGTGAFTQVGAGTTTLTAANTFTGATSITAGTLRLSNSLALQNSTFTGGAGALVFDSSVTGNAFTFGGLAGNSNIVLQNNAATPGAIALTFGGNNTNQTYAGVLSGSGSLIKAGTGTETITNRNTFTGNFTINGGTVETAVQGTGGNSAFGSQVAGRTITINNGGTLSFTINNVFDGNTGTPLVINAGGTVTSTRFNILGSVTLNGGTLTQNATDGTGTAGFQGYAFNNGVTVGGTSASTISAGSNGAGDHLTANTTFNVGSTGATGPDLLVSARLINQVGDNNSAGGLTKTGAGTMALTAANIYNGATTISGGTFQLGNGGTTGTLSTSSAIVDNATFAVNRSNAVLQGTDFSAAAITGTGGFTQTGTGTTTLNAANTYAGATTVSGGTLNLTGGLTSAITVNSGGTLTGVGNGTTTGKTTGSLTVGGGGAVTLAAANAATPFTVGGALTLGGTGTYGAGQYSTFNFTLGSGIEALNASGALTLNLGGAYINLIGAAANGTYNLLTYSSQTGAGSFSLSSTSAGVTSTNIGRSTYTLLDGPTALQLQVTGAAAPGIAYFNGAVSSRWNDVSNANAVNFSTNKAGTIDAGQIVGPNTNVILNADNATANRGSSALNETLGASTTINSLSVNGNGTTTIAADGSTLTINALADSNGNTAGTGITIGSDANAFTVNVPVALGNSQSWTNNSANLFTVGGTSVTGAAITGTQTLTLGNTSTGGTTISAVIGNGNLGGNLALAVNNSGTGSTILTGANTYTGGTTITAGTLQLGDGTTGHDGSITGAVTNNGSLVVNHFGNQTISGVISGTGTFTKTGAGTLILANSETFTGGTTVNGGILQLNSGGGSGGVRGSVTVNTGGTLYLSTQDALGYNAGAFVTTLTVNGGSVDNRTGSNQGFSTNFNLTGATVKSTGGGMFNFGAGTSITNNASATTSVFSGIVNIRGDSGNNNLPISVATGTTASGVDLLISGVVSQQGATDGIIKSGTGTLALSASNTFQGPTAINGGTLSAAGAGALGNTGSITVNTGGTLLISSNASTDHINNSATATENGGTIKIATGVQEGAAALLSGGSASGTSGVGLGALTLTASSTLDFDANGGSTLLVFSGFNPTSFTLTIAGYTNASYNGTNSSGAATDDRLVFNQMLTTEQLAAINFGSGFAATQVQLGAGSSFYEIGTTPVPEPSTWVGAGLITGLAGWSQRKRFSKLVLRQAV